MIWKGELTFERTTVESMNDKKKRIKKKLNTIKNKGEY